MSHPLPPVHRNHDPYLPYDLDLACTGRAWAGTFGGTVEHTAHDILTDGPYGPVEITYATDADTFTTVTGVLYAASPSGLWLTNCWDMDADPPRQTDMTARIAVEKISRFRA